MERVPGIHTATLLFEMGLGFDAVIRALGAEIGMPADQAERAATAAEIAYAARSHDSRVHVHV